MFNSGIFHVPPPGTGACPNTGPIGKMMFIKRKMGADPDPMGQRMLLLISAKEIHISHMLIQVYTHLNSTMEAGGRLFNLWGDVCFIKV